MLSDSLRQFQLAALALVLLTVTTRLPSLLHPLPFHDEPVYSVVANEIVDGGRPYADAADWKPPLLFWTYAAVFEVAGKFNWKALHMLSLIWTLCTMAGLFVIGRQLFNRDAGLVAALLYSVFEPWATWENLSFNGELMMNLPLVWAYAIAFRQSSSRLRPDLLLSGALLCAGFLLKQPAAIAAIPLGIYLLLPSYRTSRGLTPTTSLIHGATLTAGFFGTLGLVMIILWKQGILYEAFYWTITVHAIPHMFWDKGAVHTLAFIGACLPLVIGAAMAFRDVGDVWAGKGAERTALFGLLIASAIGVVTGARFFPHYYIQLIPPLTALAAPYYARLWIWQTQPSHWLLRPKVAGAWLALTVVGFSIAHWHGLGSRRQPTETGRYLLEHSKPDERLFVWGHSPKIYVEAQRRPACRYILTFPLTGHVLERLTGIDQRKWIVPEAWTHLEQDFASHPPAYIVDLYASPGAQCPVENFPVLARLLAERYRLVARTAEGVVYQMR